jgi:hypothetical protein
MLAHRDPHHSPPTPQRRTTGLLPTLGVALALLIGACSGATSAGLSDAPAASTASRPPDAGLTVAAADAGHQWADTGKATIRPGMQTYTQGSGQCTTNFVFVDNTSTVYLGQAAHCAGTGKENETNGCKTSGLPLGTPITFNKGGSITGNGTVVGKGQLAYSSWLTMHQRKEADANTCAYNDFALVRIPAADAPKVNPSIPFWGGPTGITTTGTKQLDRVFSYGNSSIRGGVTALSPQEGVSRGDDPALGGWSHTLSSPTPGIPGDSGSAYLDPSGNALGTLSTLGLSIPAINSIGDLNRELTYARAFSGIPGLRLVLGNERFDSGRLERSLQSGPPQPPPLPAPPLPPSGGF